MYNIVIPVLHIIEIILTSIVNNRNLSCVLVFSFVFESRFPHDKSCNLANE